MPQAHALEGRLFAKQSRLEQAQKEFHQALTLNPALVSARVGLGGVLVKLGFTNDAMRELRKSLEEDSRSEEAHFQMGLALFASGRQQEAQRSFEEAVRLAPGFIEA